MTKKNIIYAAVWVGVFVITAIVLLHKKNNAIVRITVNDVYAEDVAHTDNDTQSGSAVNNTKAHTLTQTVNDIEAGQDVSGNKIEWTLNGRKYHDIINLPRTVNNLYGPTKLSDLAQAGTISIQVDKGAITSFKLLSVLWFCKISVVELPVPPASSVQLPFSVISQSLDALNWSLLAVAAAATTLAALALRVLKYLHADQRVCASVQTFMRILLCRRVSIYAVPWMVSMVMTYYLCIGVAMSKQHYFGGRCCLLAILLTLGWTILFASKQYQLCSRKTIVMHIRCPLIIVLILAYIAGTYFGYCVWGHYFQSVFPYDALDIGMVMEDTLLHSAIAESFSRSMNPSLLLNDEQTINYHAFSHLLMYTIANLMSVPAFTAYNYLYPVIFVPIYPMTVLLAIIAAKKYFTNLTTITFFDLILVTLFFVGITENPALYMAKTHIVYMSESFLIANTEFFLALAFGFYVLHNWQHNRWLMILYGSAIIPIELFFISWTKISTGFLFAAMTIYLTLRIGHKRITSWGLSLFYGLVFLGCLALFSSFLATINNPASYHSHSGRWLALSHYFCHGSMGILGHWLIISFFTILYVFFDTYKNKYTWKDVKNGKTKWLETATFLIVISCFIQTIPTSQGITFALISRYFTLGAMIPSLVLLCGHNYTNIATGNLKDCAKLLIYSFLCSWCIWVGYHQRTSVVTFWQSRPVHPFYNPLTPPAKRYFGNATTKQKNAKPLAALGLCKTLLHIRNMVGNDPQDYAIYLDNDSLIDTVYGSRALAKVLVCQALTKVGVINATYAGNGRHFNFANQPIPSWQYGIKGSDRQLTYEQALSLAKLRGKKKLIHISHTGYGVIDLAYFPPIR